MKTQCCLTSGIWRTTVWLSGRPIAGARVTFKDSDATWWVSAVWDSRDDVPTQHDSGKIWKATSGKHLVGHK